MDYPRSDYAVCPCTICTKGISLSELLDGVYWLPGKPKKRRWLVLEGWEQAEHVHAHKRCWKSLSEKARRRIRSDAWPGQEPKTLGGNL